MRPKASEDLHGYLAWRRKVKALPEGTIVVFEVFERGMNTRNDIKAGSYFLLSGTRPGMFAKDLLDASRTYNMVQCSKSGKPFKRDMAYTVEGIAGMIEEGTVSVHFQPEVVYG